MYFTTTTTPQNWGGTTKTLKWQWGKTGKAGLGATAPRLSGTLAGRSRLKSPRPRVQSGGITGVTGQIVVGIHRVQGKGFLSRGRRRRSRFPAHSSSRPLKGWNKMKKKPSIGWIKNLMSWPGVKGVMNRRLLIEKKIWWLRFNKECNKSAIL